MALAMLWPLIRLCRRAGIPAYYALTVAVPLFGPAIIASILAFRRWPTLPPLPPKPQPRKRN